MAAYASAVPASPLVPHRRVTDPVGLPFLGSEGLFPGAGPACPTPAGPALAPDAGARPWQAGF